MTKTISTLTLFTAVFLLTIYKLKQRINKNVENKSYTIALIMQKKLQKNGVLCHHTFQVYRNTFEATFRHNSKSIQSGAGYFVSYNQYNPDQNFLEL